MNPNETLQAKPINDVFPLPLTAMDPEQQSTKPPGDPGPWSASPSQGVSHPLPHLTGPWHCPHHTDSAGSSPGCHPGLGAPRAGSDLLSSWGRAWLRAQRLGVVSLGGSHIFPFTCHHRPPGSTSLGSERAPQTVPGVQPQATLTCPHTWTLSATTTASWVGSAGRGG